MNNNYSLYNKINLDSLAVISITVYDRLEHFKLCIESLKTSHLAAHSTLYIFSDAAKVGDEEKISFVRDFISSISGFKLVIPIFQSVNNYSKNLKDAREIPLKVHKRMIRLEDDLIVSPFFLEYMNISLEYFENDKNVLGVSGYSPPIDKSIIDPDTVYLSKIWSGWSYGVWSEKNFFEYLYAENPYFDMVKQGLFSKVKEIHPRLHVALRKISNGIYFAGDQILTYVLIKHDLFQIKPRFSLVKNIGFDGTGVHCGYSNMFNQDPSQVAFELQTQKKYFRKIDRNQFEYFYYKNSLFVKIYKKIIWSLSDIKALIYRKFINLFQSESYNREA